MCLICYAPDAPHAGWGGQYRIARVKPRGESLHGLYALELEDCSGWREVLYRGPLDESRMAHPPIRGQVVVVSANVIRTQATHGGWYDRVTSLEGTPVYSALQQQPFRRCPQPHALLRLYELLNRELQHPALRLFVDCVFDEPPIAQAFISIPASRDCHHAEPRGLLAHSLELVEKMAVLATQCEQVIRECLLVVALFHDVGKVVPRVLSRTPYWSREHPLTNKMVLERALSKLHHQDQTAWSMVHFLLDVLAGAVDGKRIPEAELLLALDRVSAATDARERARAMAGSSERVVALQPSNGGPKRLFYQVASSHSSHFSADCP